MSEKDNAEENTNTRTHKIFMAAIDIIRMSFYNQGALPQKFFKEMK